MDVVASPSVRRLALERGIDIEQLATRLGRVTIAREDVLGARTVHDTLWEVDHEHYGPISIESLNRIAQTASKRLVAAQQHIPTVTHHGSADLTRVEDARAILKAKGTRITALSFHIAILARCLRDFPRFNSSISADGKSLIFKHYVHIGIAVDTHHGLMVPVIRDSDKKSIPDLSLELLDVSERARARGLRPEEFGGGSMTISSLGGIGGEAFTPIINPPEVAILGISQAGIRPVWDGAAFSPTMVVPLDLSYDHRVINGADAARFLKRYCDLVRNPDDLLA